MKSQILKINLSDFSKRLAWRQRHYGALLKGNQVLIRGSLPELIERVDSPAIAIVGTRRATDYGKNFVSEFLKSIAKERPNTNIVSGGAFGIDTAAHVTALKLGLSTQAWVVGPIASPNPRSQARVFEVMEQRIGSGVICIDSLEPDLMGRNPRPNDWLCRNAWIAASCDALIVVEATLHSGTQSTVDYAMTFGLPVYILPGPIDSPQSQGTNSMISTGCGHVIETIEILTKRLLVDLELASYNESRGSF